MKIISGTETGKYTGDTRFIITRDEKWRRNIVGLCAARSFACRRLEFRPGKGFSRLPYFLLAVINILDESPWRALCIEDYDENFASIYHTVMAIRNGAGESRSLFDAPIHIFGPYGNWDEDQVSASAEFRKDIDLLIGISCLVLIAGWSAKIWSEGGNDFLELWDGNLLFYSEDDSKLEWMSEAIVRFDFEPEMA